MAVVSNANAPQEVRVLALSFLQALPEDRKQELLDDHAPLQWLVMLAAQGRSDARLLLAKHPLASQDMLSSLVRDEDEAVRSSVAANPAASQALLEALAFDSSPEVRFAVAMHPASSESLLLALGADKAVGVQVAVAWNQSATKQVLDALAKRKKSDAMKEAMANHPNTSPGVLHGLLREASGAGGWRYRSIRVLIAGNPSATPQMLESLIDDWSWEVRLALAANPSASADLLQRLAADEDPSVRARVAASDRVDVIVLDALAVDAKAEVRRAVGRNPKVSVATLEALAKDRNADVRFAVTCNPSTPQALAETLLQLSSRDGHPDARREAARRSILRTTPGSTLADRLALRIAEMVKQAVQHCRIVVSGEHVGLDGMVAPSEFPKAFEWMGLVPDDSRKSLDRACKSKDWLTRLAVVLHPKVSEAQRLLLASDSDPAVAAAARLATSGVQAQSVS